MVLLVILFCSITPQMPPDSLTRTVYLVITRHYCMLGGIIVLAACTDINVLDDALLRPGRLEHHIRLDLPNRADIKAILAGRLSKLTCSDDVDADNLADILISKLDLQVTGADVENVCRRALMSRIRERIILDSSLLGKIEPEGFISIGNKNFLEAIEECYPSMTDCVSLSEEGREGTGGGKSKMGAVPFVWTGGFSEGIRVPILDDS